MDEVVPPVFARFREGLRSGNCRRDGARRGNFIPSISLPFYFGRRTRLPTRRCARAADRGNPIACYAELPRDLHEIARGPELKSSDSKSASALRFPNKALWEKGDFTRIAESMRESGEALVKGLGIKNGLKVLDLGCDGTTALPEAKLGADVLGVDIAKNLVEAGNKRAKEQGLTNCKFQEGDASNLEELKDHTFDLVVSIFGAMFAPKPFDVAREMVRVSRPGGRVVMGNWIPNDPTLVAQILKISAAYSPPPPTCTSTCIQAAEPVGSLSRDRYKWT